MQGYQQFDVDIVPQACNFIKSETPAQVFSRKVLEYFQLVTLLKTRIQHRCFLVNFAKIFKKLN